MDIKEEEEIIWKEIPTMEEYEASNLGYIKSKDKTKILKPKKNRNGYLEVHLRIEQDGKKISKTQSVHRLIALAFLKYRKGYEVHHKNGIKTDNRKDNLEWIKHKHNVRHYLIKGSETHASDEEIRKIRELYASKKFNQVQLAKIYKTSQGHISNIILKRCRWWI